MLQEVALPGGQMADPSLFLPAVTKFANERCWGNLSCSLFVHPEVCWGLCPQFCTLIDGLHCQVTT